MRWARWTGVTVFVTDDDHIGTLKYIWKMKGTAWKQRRLEAIELLNKWSTLYNFRHYDAKYGRITATFKIRRAQYSDYYAQCKGGANRQNSWTFRWSGWLYYKPFHHQELMARVKSQPRRYNFLVQWRNNAFVEGVGCGVTKFVSTENLSNLPHWV